MKTKVQRNVQTLTNAVEIGEAVYKGVKLIIKFQGLLE